MSYPWCSLHGLRPLKVASNLGHPAVILSRQFVRIGLEKMLKIQLSDFGYQFYQTPKERVTPIKKLWEHLLPGHVEKKTAGKSRAVRDPEG